MLDAIELSGDDVLVAAAERQGVMDRVEDELFRFERILDAEGSLASLLDEAIALRVAAPRTARERRARARSTRSRRRCSPTR